MGSRGSDAKRRALKKKLWKRDRICYYCLLPLNPEIPYPDDWSVEIDEIVPKSLGGDIYSLDNTRLAHRWCNNKRSNKTDEDIFPGCFNQEAIEKINKTLSRNRKINSKLL